MRGWEKLDDKIWPLLNGRNEVIESAIREMQIMGAHLDDIKMLYARGGDMLVAWPKGGVQYRVHTKADHNFVTGNAYVQTTATPEKYLATNPTGASGDE